MAEGTMFTHIALPNGGGVHHGVRAAKEHRRHRKYEIEHEFLELW